jgi:hypothetical protein
MLGSDAPAVTCYRTATSLEFALTVTRAPLPRERVRSSTQPGPSSRVAAGAWYKAACAQGADAINMQRSAWGAVLLVVLAGWGIAGLMAVTLVSLVGWLGILIIGLAMVFAPRGPNWATKPPRGVIAAIRAELGANGRRSACQLGAAG